MATFRFVVDKDLPGPTTNDQVLMDILTAAGHTVSSQLETAAAPTAGTYDCIVITESGSASSVNKYVGYADPVICLETAWNTLKVTTAGATNSGSSSLSIDLATHDINTGFSDPLTIKSSGTTGNYSVATTALASGATTFAYGTGGTTRAYGVAVDAGGTLTSGTAAARIVCVGLIESQCSGFSTDGEAWWVSICEWAAGVGGGTAFTVNHTDTTGLSDSVKIDRSQTRTDSTGLTDSRSLTFGMTRQDSVGLADSALVSIRKTQNQVDSVGLSETVAKALYQAQYPTFLTGSNITYSATGDVTFNPGFKATGDLMIAILVTRGNSGADTAPSGWTAVGDNFHTASLQFNFAIAYKVMTGSEPSNYTWNMTASQDAIVLVWRCGAGTFDPDNPITDWAFVNDNDVTDTDISIDALDNVGNYYGRLLMGVYSNSDGIDYGMGMPTGYTGTNHAGINGNIEYAVWSDNTATSSDFGTLTTGTSGYGPSYGGSVNLAVRGKRTAYATGTTHTVNQTDTTGLTDSAIRAMVLGRTLLDTVAVTDADFARAWAHKPVFTDPVAISEVIHKLRGHTKQDTVNIADALGFMYPRGPQDSMGITDSIEIQISRGMTFTDAVNTTDSVEFDYGKGFVDSLIITDEVSFIKSMERTFTESFNLSEDISIVLPNAASYSDTVGITDTATVALILNTLKPDSLSIVDDRRIVVQDFFSMTDDEVRVLTIGDLAYRYWSYLSQLSPVERQSLYDHFKTYQPDGRNWIEDITEQP